MQRLITIWPFPYKKIRALSQKIDKFIVIEMNLGQIFHKVTEHAKDCEVESLFKIGGEIPNPKEILKIIKEK